MAPLLDLKGKVNMQNYFLYTVNLNRINTPLIDIICTQILQSVHSIYCDVLCAKHPEEHRNETDMNRTKETKSNEHPLFEGYFSYTPMFLEQG